MKLAETLRPMGHSKEIPCVLALIEAGAGPRLVFHPLVQIR